MGFLPKLSIRLPITSSYQLYMNTASTPQHSDGLEASSAVERNNYVVV